METPIIADSVLDKYYQLSPVEREKIHLLPLGTLAVCPVGRPSSIDLCI